MKRRELESDEFEYSMNKLEEYVKDWVPGTGKCKHLAGEIVRALNKINKRFDCDCHYINIDAGKELCNAPARFLKENINDNEIKEIIDDMWAPDDLEEFDDDVYFDEYESNLNYLIKVIIDYIDNHPELQKIETLDMWDYYDKEIDSYNEK